MVPLKVVEAHRGTISASFSLPGNGGGGWCGAIESGDVLTVEDREFGSFPIGITEVDFGYYFFGLCGEKTAEEEMETGSFSGN